MVKLTSRVLHGETDLRMAPRGKNEVRKFFPSCMSRQE